MSKPFSPELITRHEWSGASSGELHPGREAQDIGLKIHGAWLMAYMFRRFGPPNSGSDDYKQLCTWTISTPMPGLALSVTPYLGDQGEDSRQCLHFGYQWSRKLADAVYAVDRKASLESMKKLHRWQYGKFVGVLIEDVGTREIIKEFQFQNKAGEEKTAALCHASASEKKDDLITLSNLYTFWDAHDALHKLFRKRYPSKPRKPKANGRWPVSAIARKCNLALRASIRALTQPIEVRDVGFGITGRVKDYPKNLADRFEHAGYPCLVDMPKKEVGK